MAFDSSTLTKAREAGYSDDEVISFAAQSDPRIKTAIDSGYSLDEVAAHFDPKPEQEAPETQVTAERPAGELSSRFLASAASGTLDAVTMLGRVASVMPTGKLQNMVASVTGGATTEDAINFLKEASGRAKDDYGVMPEHDKGLASAVASGAGSMLPIVATGPFAPYTGALMAGEQGYSEAEEAGGSTTQKIVSAAGNAATAFVTEKLLGLPALLKSAKAAKIPDGTFSEMVKSVVGQIGKGFVREGTQETLEQIASDTIAKHIAAYDSERKIFDAEKLGTTFLAGGIIGAGMGGVLQTAENAAPVEEMKSIGEDVDSALAETAISEPPPVVPAPPPSLVPSIQQVSTVPTIEPVPPTQPAPVTPPVAPTEPVPTEPAGEPVVEATPPTPPTKPLSPHKPQGGGESIVSTAIRLPNGEVVTGQEWKSGHATMLMEALDKGLPETDYEANLGFIVQREDGTQEFIGREEALEIARRSGQVDESKLTSNTKGLQSEGLIERSPNAVQEQETATIPGGVPQQPAKDAGQMPATESAGEISSGSQERGTVSEEVTTIALGASNVREMKIAQATKAASILQEQGENPNRETWEQALTEEYPDTFTPQEIDQLWELSNQAAQEFREKGGNKPLARIIDQMTGGRKGEGTTGIKRATTDKQREEMGLTPAKQDAKRSLPHVWDEAQKLIEEDPYIEAETLNKYRNSNEVPTDTEKAIILNAKIEAENRLAEVVDEYNKAETPERKVVLQKEMQDALAKVQDVFDIAKAVGSASGRSLNAQKLMADRDFTLTRMLAETQAAKGEPLTAEEIAEVQKDHDELNLAKSELETRTSQKEEELSREQAQETLDAMSKDVEPEVKSLLDRILERMKTAHDAALTRLRHKLKTTNMLVNPTILSDMAIIGAYHIAKGIRKLSDWKKAMSAELDGAFEEHYDKVFEEANRRVDETVESVIKTAPAKEKVRKTIKNPTLDQVIDDTQSKMRNRLKEGDNLSDLRSYIQKLALALVRKGTTQLDPLLDTLHSMIQPMAPDITRREVMDLFSGYGDVKLLDKEASKAIVRDLKGQSQQLAKIEDIQTSGTMKKTGVERRTPSDAERRLIKEVNRLKKEKGVRTTDPETQLKTSIESTKTRIKNDIRDLTHQIETGEQPIPGTPAPTDQEIENLKEIRSRLKDFLKKVESVSEPSDSHIKAYEKEVKAIESAIKSSIKSYEAQLKGEKKFPKKRDFTNAKIEALKSRRDALRSSVEAMKAADEDLRNTREFDRLTRDAEKLQEKLARGDVKPTAKAEKIDDPLVKEAREKLSALRDQMRAARESTDEFKAAKLEAAIRAVEKSIQNYDNRLKTGDIAPKPGAPKVTSPIIERLKAERDALRKLVQELRKGPSPSPEEVALKSYKSRIQNRIADMESRIASNDFAPKKKRELDLSKDAEAVKLRAQYEKALKAFQKRKFDFERQNETKLKKVLRGTAEGLGVIRSVKSSFDLSAVLGQGGFTVLGHPIRSLKAVRDMVKSFTAKGFEQVEAELKNRPNYQNGNYQRAKLALASLDGKLTEREENFQSTLAEKIPGVKWSERTYTAFLNRLRADSFDALLASQPLATPEQKRALAHFVNAATGRGDLGRFAPAAEAASAILWSPRLLVSRIQLLAGEPLARGDAKGVRTAIAKEYARTLGGIGVIMALGVMAGADVEEDPKSTDFGKLRFGDLRIDPWVGVQPLVTLAARSNPFGPQATNQKGRTYSLREGDPGRTPVDPTWADLMFRFTRGKMTPLLGAVFNTMAGENVVGEPVRTPGEITRELAPLSLQDIDPMALFSKDIHPFVQEYGVPKGAALFLLNALGARVQLQERK